MKSKLSLPVRIRLATSYLFILFNLSLSPIFAQFSSDPTLGTKERDIINSLNAVRNDNGVAPLSTNFNPYIAAHERSWNMAQQTGIDGSSIQSERFSVEFFAGFVSGLSISANADDIVNQMFNIWSEAEIQAALSPDAKHIGVSIAQASNGTLWLTVVVGNRKPISSPLIFSSIPNQPYSQNPILLTAVSQSGLSVNFEVVSGPASVSNDELTLTGTGQVFLRAFVSGNNTYDDAEAFQSFTVTKIDQTLIFNPIENVLIGESALLQATSSSGLPIEFAVSGPAILESNQLFGITGGDVIVTATQSGNELYNPVSINQTVNIVSPYPDNLLNGWFPDLDSDGYGDGNTSLISIFALPGYVKNNHDCDDGDPNINPGSMETEDGKDNNCDGQVDEGFGTPQIADLTVTATCTDYPLFTRRWKIENPNSDTLALEWEIIDTHQKSWFELPPGDSYLTTLFIWGSQNRLSIFWHNHHGERKSLESDPLFKRCVRGSSARTGNGEEGRNEITEDQAGEDMKVYPNPGSDYITMQVPSEFEGQAPLTIISTNGKEVVKKYIQLSKGTNFITEDISSLPNGIYIIKAGRDKFKFIKK